MIKITLQYQKKVWIKNVPFPFPTLKFVNEEVDFPEKVEELNAEAFQFLSPFLLTGNVTDEALIYALKFIFKMDDATFFQMTSVQVDILVKKLDFLRQPVSYISETMIRKVTMANGTVMEGPEDSLADLSMEEMSYCEAYYLAFFENKDMKYARKLAASLYRPNRSDVAFNDLKIREYVEMWKEMPDSLVYAIAVQYHFQMKCLEEDYPIIFPKNKTGKTRANNMMWSDLIYSLPTESYGTLEERKRTKVSDFLGESEYRLLNPKK
jgi:hypothetical protein